MYTQTGRRTDRWSDIQVVRQTGSHVNRGTHRQVEGQTDGQTDRWSGRLVVRQTGGQPDW